MGDRLRSRALAAAFACACGLVASPSAHADAPKEQFLDLGGEAMLVLVQVPAGSFTQGPPPGDEAPADDVPHRVTLSKSYFVGKFPVTRGQFARFVAEAGYRTEAEVGQSGGFGAENGALVQKKGYNWKSPGFVQADDHPVVLVTYADAESFASWLGVKVRRTVRLPTEAEYEYALRGGSNSPWYGAKSSDEALALGWFKGNSGGATHPVGQKKPNDFGAHDMAGDVFEWCRDAYAPYAPKDATDPEVTAPSAGEPLRRVLRGGSWMREPKWGRNAARYRATPGTRNAENGFRIVVTDDSAAPSAPTFGAAGLPVGEPYTPPPTPPAPPSKSTHTRGSSPPFGLLLLPVAIVGLIVWLVSRGRRAAVAPVPSIERAPPIWAEARADGFVIHAPSTGPAQARYRCVVNGQHVANIVTLTGPQTFVYTGGYPSNVQILGVAPVMATAVASPFVPMRRPAAAPPQASTFQHHDQQHHHHHHHHHGSPLQGSFDSARRDDDPQPFLGFPRAY